MSRYIIKIPTLAPDRFAILSKRCEEIINSIGCKLAGWDGTGDPVFSDTEITFNVPHGTEDTFSLTLNGDSNTVIETDDEVYNLAIKCCLLVFLIDIGDQVERKSVIEDKTEWETWVQAEALVNG